MELLCKIFLLCLVAHASKSVRVTLEGGGTGTVIKKTKEGESVTLSCSASASSSGGTPNLEWLYATSPNAAGTHIYYNSLIVDGFDRISLVNPYSLAISELISSDSGFYTCRVTIPGDTPSVGEATYNFTVLVPPYDQISCGFPSDLKITLGQSASFQCKEVVAQAVPAPTYTWYKNNVLLPTTSANNPLYANSSFSYSTQTGVLKFSSVGAGDAGTYYCEASNEVGSQKCSAAAITTKEVNVGAIVGIVFGVIFGLILIGVLIWWSWKRGYCDGLFEGKEHEDEAPDEGANDVMLDGAGPLVTKEPSEWSNGGSNRQEASMMI